MEAFWRKKARAVSLRMNLAFWLDSALPLLSALAVGIGCAMLIFRHQGWEIAPLWMGAGILAIGMGLGALWRASRCWADEAVGLIRLEVVHSLHNRLSCAAAGVGTWPEARPVDDGWRWNWRRLLGPLAVSGLFLVLSVWVPVSTPSSPGRAQPDDEPIAWGQIEAALDEIAPHTAPEATEETRKQLEALRERERKEWYSQGSLEASDALRTETGHALARLENHLASALDLLARGDTSQTTEALWKDAVRGMQGDKLPLNADTLARMAMDLSSLSPSEREALSQSLAANQAAAQQGLEALGQSMQALEARLMGDAPQQGTGSGDVGRGGDSAPLGFENAPKEFAVEGQLPISSHDRERLALGDSVRMVQGEHEPPKDLTPATGGSVSTLGKGGEAVWKNDLPPKEQAVLRRFFE